MNFISQRVRSLFSSLFISIIIALIIILFHEKVLVMTFGIHIHLPIVMSYLGIIIFLSFWVLAENSLTPVSRINRYMYIFMMAGGLFLAKSLFSFWLFGKDIHNHTNKKDIINYHQDQDSNNKGGFTWYTSIKKAQEAASNQSNKDNKPSVPVRVTRAREGENKKRPILIYFSADWCLPCHTIEKKLFPSQEFKDFVKKHEVILLLYDMNQPNLEGDEIASKYLVAGLPTMILTDHQGKEIDKVLGFRSIKKTMQELKEVISMRVRP